MWCTPIIGFVLLVQFRFREDARRFFQVNLYNHVHCFRDARLTLQLEKKNAKKKKHILKKKNVKFF